MRKPKINYIVDVILFGLMGGIVFIGILLGWALPAGPGQEKYFWSLHRHQWGDIHLWLSILFLAFLVVHLVLHWKWIRGSTQKILGRSWILPLFVLVPAMVILLAQAGYSGDNVDRKGWGQRSGRQCQQLQPEKKCSKEKQKRKRHRGGKRGKQRHRRARGTSR
jgi:hypothetical protein